VPRSHDLCTRPLAAHANGIPARILKFASGDGEIGKPRRTRSLAHALHRDTRDGTTMGGAAMDLSAHAHTELCSLTDSLSSSIRWRMRDYEAILRAELEILTEPDAATLKPLVPSAGRPERRH
jgi:hypothetical protein